MPIALTMLRQDRGIWSCLANPAANSVSLVIHQSTITNLIKLLGRSLLPQRDDVSRGALASHC